MSPLSVCYCLVGDAEMVEVYDGETYLVPRKVFESTRISDRRTKSAFEVFKISDVLADALMLP